MRGRPNLIVSGTGRGGSIRTENLVQIGRLVAESPPDCQHNLNKYADKNNYNNMAAMRLYSIKPLCLPHDCSDLIFLRRITSHGLVLDGGWIMNLYNNYSM